MSKLIINHTVPLLANKVLACNRSASFATLTHSLPPLGVADVAALRLLVGRHVADAAAAVVQTDGLGALHSHGLNMRCDYDYYIFF